jgi:hypothetical protein
MTTAERQDETAYYDGANGESFDYRLSSRQIDAEPPPAGAAFHLLISTSAQCESPTDICGRTYLAYQQNMRHLVADWPDGRLTEAAAGHEIYLDDMEAVTAAINDVLDRAST